jgi:hypothetical protein
MSEVFFIYDMHFGCLENANKISDLGLFDCLILTRVACAILNRCNRRRCVSIPVDGLNGMDPPLSSAAFMSQNGCGIFDNH